MIEDGFILTRSLAAKLPVSVALEGAGRSPSLGVRIGSLGRGSGAAPTKEAELSTFSNTVSTSLVEAPSTLTGVAMTPTARIVAKKDAKKTLDCILNERGAKE